MKKINMQALMVLGTFFWAGAFIAGKFGVSQFTPSMLTFLRFAIAFAIILIVLIRRQPNNWLPTKREWSVILLLGMVGMVGYHILFFEALKYTTAVHASMLAATNPILTALLAALFAKERFPAYKVVYILLALTGVILTVTDWNLKLLWTFQLNKGDVIMFFAVSCWAVYSVLVRLLGGRMGPLKLTTWVFGVCAAAVMPFAFTAEGLTHLQSASGQTWGAVLYMAVFPTVLGYLIQQTSIRTIGASRTNIFINLVPVFSMFLAVLILREEVLLQGIVSGMMVISGVWLFNRKAV